MAPAAAHRDAIVVGASAGGVEAPTRPVARLPGGLAGAVLMVLHIGVRRPSGGRPATRRPAHRLGRQDEARVRGAG